MQTISTVGIISKPKIARAPELVSGLLAWLDARGVRYRCDQLTAEYAGRTTFCSREDLHEGIDLLIVLGGDGTLLSAARAVASHDTPIFAVNLGHLGFLTTIREEELYPELERAIKGDYRIGRRRMVDCELYRDGKIDGSLFGAERRGDYEVDAGAHDRSGYARR